MSSEVCESVRTRLVVDGEGLVMADSGAARHLRECPACRRFAAALGSLDLALAQMPERDAPDELSARVLDAVQRPEPARAAPATSGLGSRRTAAAMAAVVVVLACAGLVHSLYTELRGPDWHATAPSPRLSPRLPGLEERPDFQFQGLLRSERPIDQNPRAFARVFAYDEGERELLAERGRSTPAGEAETLGNLRATVKEGRRETGKYGPGTKAEAQSGSAGVPAIGQTPERMAALNSELGAQESKPSRAKKDGSASGAYRAPPLSVLAELATEEEIARYRQRQFAPFVSEMAPRAPSQAGFGEANVPAAPSADPEGVDLERAAARRFLAGRETLDGLVFEPAAGYWANTYLPGAPEMRLLGARLRSGMSPVPVVDARPNWQPFDPPRDAALAAYLHADKSAISGPTRLRVQVGLQGAQRRGGHRPAMNVAVVLDLRTPVSEPVGTRIRALMAALVGARRAGDRFSLTVAGRPGGMLVSPEQFRHGPLQVALGSLFSRSGEAAGETLELLDAMTLATRSVQAGDAPGAALGTSMVLLVATGPLGAALPGLERMAHGNAVQGIPVSAVALGGRVDLDEVDGLTLLGQGHRRTLATPAEAVTLVDRELHAASRAVARAVRLRIRLAPGVRLVRVLGAGRLDVSQAGRVREAERSIDQRLSRNLGIRADRGDDEEGIQIVIPSFFAGDAHVVLLDVVAERAGPVADLTIRYKDLVHLRNGVLRAGLAVAAGERPPGPLERNVLKNELAHELANAARAASAHVAEGDRAAAASVLAATRTLLRGMRREIGVWADDAELLNDEATLSAYVDLLRSPVAAAPTWLADALRYLAHRRLVAPQE